jgi:hypothetical protein
MTISMGKPKKCWRTKRLHKTAQITKGGKTYHCFLKEGKWVTKQGAQIAKWLDFV